MALLYLCNNKERATAQRISHCMPQCQRSRRVAIVLLFLVSTVSLRHWWSTVRGLEWSKSSVATSPLSSSSLDVESTNQPTAEVTTTTAAASTPCSVSESPAFSIVRDFPQCVLPLPQNWNGKQSSMMDFFAHGEFQYVLSEHIPRYDHISCPIMKARYNCAVSTFENPNGTISTHGTTLPVMTTRPTASSYKLIWTRYNAPNKTTDMPIEQNPFNSDNVYNDTFSSCDFRHLMNVVGGPANVAAILSGREGTTTTTASRPPYYHVLMQGNSFLRQIFEALVCGFQDQITDMKVLLHGPSISRSNGTATTTTTTTTTEHSSSPMSPKKFTIADLGRPVSNWNSIQKHGCHGAGQSHGSRKTHIARFYHDNVTIPPSASGCTDDMAMVEFQHSIRFYFLYHPSMFDDSALLRAYDNLGLLFPLEHDMDADGTSKVIATVDALIWNDGENSVPASSATATNGGIFVKRNISLDGFLQELRVIQNTSIGHYFGADNPWIQHPPDNHPCMPGIPDDEVNVLLYLLMHAL